VVTGGAGFIGGHLAETLLALGASVSVIDDLSASSSVTIASLVERYPSRCDFFHASILEPGALAEAMQGARLVFHLAAMSAVPRSILQPERCFEVNVVGTVRVAEAARRAGVERLVLASSSSVYGVGEGVRPDQPRAESSPTNPLSPYAASKLSAEHVVSAWTHAMGLPGVSLRYFNIFGSRQPADSSYAAVIPAFLSAYQKREAPTIHGDGSFTRDFTHVDNAVLANLLAATIEADRVRGQAINVGCGQRLSIRDLAKRIARAAGAGDLDPEFGPARAGDVPHSLASLDRARSVLGYEVIRSLDEGLAETAAWAATQKPDEDYPSVLARIG
jgi:nucleoside-diphosphate-sugar epimerase